MRQNVTTMTGGGRWIGLSLAGGLLLGFSAIGLLEICLEEKEGVEIRVPHVYTLWRPTRVFYAEAPSGSRDS